MPIEILMPALSPTMTEGNLTKWLKQEGDKISPGEIIAEIETDKATMEVEAVDAGILAKIVIPQNTEAVKVNQLIALILEEDEDPKELDNYHQLPSKITDQSNNLMDVAELDNKDQSDQLVDHQEERIFASPLAKKIAIDAQLKLDNIVGTGPHGRIIKDDVLKLIENQKVPKITDNVVTNNYVRNLEEYTKITNSNMRKVIAKRLSESKQHVPHFYLNIDCQLDKLITLRKEINEGDNRLVENYKLSINDFIIKATALALKKVPQANASWTEEAILQYNNIDISVAVAIEGGLITPIIRNADQKSLLDISTQMKQLVTKAKENKLTPSEFQGGGFSISNLGMYNIKRFNAIVNPPQGCILAIGSSNKQPIVKDDQIIIASIMDVTLSSDHRVVDGAIGAEFLNNFKHYIENPLSMLI